MKNYKLKLLYVLFLTILLSYCISLKKEFPEKLYIIEPDKTKIVKKANKIERLKINKLRISPFFEGKELVYRKNDVNYETDYYHEFLIYPASNITEQIVTWLISSGMIKYSINRTAGLDFAYVLDGTINLLYGDFKDDTPKAILEIEFYLLDNSSNVLFKKVYHTETELEKKEPIYLVKGWNLGLTKIILNLENDIRKLALNKEITKDQL